MQVVGEEVKPKSLFIISLILLFFSIYCLPVGIYAEETGVATTQPSPSTEQQTKTTTPPPLASEQPATTIRQQAETGGSTGGSTTQEPVQQAKSAPASTLGGSGATVSSPGNSGTASAGIPIQVPPGRNGIAPNLTLSYNSSKGNGWIGLGWDISLGEIARPTKRGVDYAANDFVFSIGGSTSELVSRSSDWGNDYFGLKTEGEFSKFYHDKVNDRWEVTTKNGTKYYYGKTPYDSGIDGRQDNANGVFKWCLVWVQDRNGNYMKISYSKNQGEIYPDRIDYTGNNTTGLSPSNYIQFYYEEGRTDAPVMYTTNSSVKTAYRLKTIDVVANGNSRASAYKLTYTTSVSTSRSLLYSVQQYGNDAMVDAGGNVSGGTTLPAMTFTWQDMDAGAQAFGGTYRSDSTGGYDSTPAWVDFNGDGRTDYCLLVNGANLQCLVSTGTGFGSTTYSSSYLSNAGTYYSKQWVDFNGDGKADFCAFVTTYPMGAFTRKVDVECTVSKGSEGFGATYTMNIADTTDNTEDWYVLHGTGNDNLPETTHEWTDFNGDGKADMCIKVITGETSFPDTSGYHGYLSCKISTDTGFGETYTSSDQHFDTTSDTGWWTDFNGDGKSDYCWGGTPNYTNSLKCILSKGDGFDTQAIDLGTEILWGYYPRQWIDFNGDGKADFCRILGTPEKYLGCTLSTGTGLGETITSSSSGFDPGYEYSGRQWVDFNGDGKADYCRTIKGGSNTTSYISCTLSTGVGFEATYTSGQLDWGYDSGRQWVDFSGDGIADYCRIVGGGPPYYAQCTVSAFPVNLLKTVENSYGGKTTISYKSSSEYPNDILPFVVQTVSSITVNDNNGNEATTNYTYEGGFFDYDSREYRGFSYVKQTNPEGSYGETYYYTQDDVYKGLPWKQIFSDSNNNVFTASLNYYQNTPYSEANFPHLNQRNEYLCDGAATKDQIDWSTMDKTDQSLQSYCKKTQADFSYDSYGNLTRKYSYGDVSVTGDEKDENTEYTYDTTNYIVALPSRTYVKDRSGVVKASIWFEYWSGTTNLKTKTFGLNVDSKSDSDNPVVNYAYDAYGNLQTVTDARGCVTTTTYDSTTHTYPATIMNCLNQTVQKTYDYRFGNVLTETDPNNNVVTNTYDPFGRLKNSSNQNTGTNAYKWKETYYDGLRRTIKVRTGGFDNKVIVQETVYNQMGQVSKTSLPYFDGSRPSCLSSDVSGCVVYKYDPVGRITKVTNPDGTFSTKSYYQGRTTIVDANGHQRVEVRDVYGRLTSVEEYTGTNTLYATTTYKYDVVDNLTDVYDAKGNNTHIEYDSLSRKTNMNDPDMGYWQYGYDKNGNLTSQTDAKSQTIQFTYDSLNRIKMKRYPDGTSVNYTYDETWSTNPIGRLTTVSDASGTQKFYYDKLGRVTKTTKTVDNIAYTIQTTYDTLGRTRSITYPDNEVVYYTYDGLDNITNVSSSKSFADYSDFGFNALGQPGGVTYGNGITTTYSYYTATEANNRLKSIVTGSLQNLTYTYYNNGNVKTITDGVAPNRTQTFVYDELDRIKTATSTVYGTISYDYDEIGNITYNSQVGSYTYGDTSHPHAVTKAGNYSYSYDENGNMTTRNEKTIIYDYDNRATSISGSSSTVTNVYDYSGQRIKKTTGTSSTIYIGKLYECNNGVCTKHIFAGSQRVASKKITSTDTEMSYFHSDHLGSTTIVTDQDRNNVQENYYYPFGETRVSTGSATNYKYTGQEEDPETGLYYYGARYYDPIIGRFISADSIVPNFANPQSLNRYSYTINNPLRYVDSNGHFFLEILIGALIGAAIGGTTAAIMQQNVLQGMLFGAVTGAFMGAASGIIGSAGPMSAIAKAGIYAAAGAAAGATNAAIYGSNIGQGALYGGAFGLAAELVPIPKFELFGSSMKNAAANIANKLFNSAVTGSVFGATFAGVTGGDVGQGAAYGAMGWAAGEAANMLIGHAVGFIGSGFKGPEFENGAFIYKGNSSGVLAVGNVLFANEEMMSIPGMPEHEVQGHNEFQGTLFGPSYLLLHGIDKLTSTYMLEYYKPLLGGNPTYYDLPVERPKTWWMWF